MRYVISTLYYFILILHQNILDIRPIYMEPTYIRLTCMDLTLYVPWCRIDVRYCDVEKLFPFMNSAEHLAY
jgi:hypothetical protein